MAQRVRAGRAGGHPGDVPPRARRRRVAGRSPRAASGTAAIDHGVAVARSHQFLLVRSARLLHTGEECYTCRALPTWRSPRWTPWRDADWPIGRRPADLRCLRFVRPWGPLRPGDELTLPDGDGGTATRGVRLALGDAEPVALDADGAPALIVGVPRPGAHGHVRLPVRAAPGRRARRRARQSLLGPLRRARRSRQREGHRLLRRPGGGVGLSSAGHWGADRGHQPRTRRARCRGSSSPRHPIGCRDGRWRDVAISPWRAAGSR